MSDEDTSIVRTYLISGVHGAFGGAADAICKQPSIFGDFRGAVDRIREDAEDTQLYEDLGGYDDVRKIFARNALRVLYWGMD